MPQCWTTRKPFAAFIALLVVAALLVLIALLFGSPFTGVPRGRQVTESVDGTPVTLSEAFARIDRGQVMMIDVLPDSYPDDRGRRWYGELESDGSLEPRWRVDGRDVLIDDTPILSADGQSVGLTEDEWIELLQRVSAYNQIAAVKITVIDRMEGYGSRPGKTPEVYTP